MKTPQKKPSWKSEEDIFLSRFWKMGLLLMFAFVLRARRRGRCGPCWIVRGRDVWMGSLVVERRRVGSIADLLRC